MSLWQIPPKEIILVLLYATKGNLKNANEYIDFYLYGLTWPGAPEARLRRGGPVEPQSLWMLHDDGWAFPETMRVIPGVSVSRSREALTRMCEAREQRLVFLVGYAGWGPGQLEKEIGQGTWLIHRASPEMVHDWTPDVIWERALREMGIDPAHLVEAAGEIQ